MSVMLLLAQLVLASVFAVAGLAKLADRDGVRQVAAEFGAPSAALTPLVWLVVSAELGVALAMTVSPWAQIGGLVALALLAVFTATVLVNLARGRRPSCHCFGRLQAASVGWSTVARNVLLASVAGFVAAEGRFLTAFAALAVVSAAGWAVLEWRRGPRARPGARAVSFALEDEAGRTKTLEALLAPRTPLLLVFSAPGCGACTMLMGDLARWQSDLNGRLTVAIVSAGSRQEHLAAAREHGLRLVLADADRAVSEAYGVQATPTAVLIGANATVAAAPAVGTDAIAALVSAGAETGADTTLARRGLLVRAARGAAAVTALPMIASATAAARTIHRAVRPEAMKIDGAWLCDQRYALCTSAKCVPSKDDPKISVCRCKVARGYSVGFKNCHTRAPKGNRLHSNFSLQDVNAKTRVMTCSEKGLWAQCLDVACRVEADHPRHAKCQCVNMRTDEFLTFGGDCDTATCSTTIWSATTKPFPGGAQYKKGIKLVGLDLTVPKSCPSPKQRAH